MDVDYDCLMEQVYYTDVDAGYIGRIDTDSPGHKVIYHGLQYPEGERSTCQSRKEIFLLKYSF